MNLGISFKIENGGQYWSELTDIVVVEREGPLSSLDYALQHFITFAAHWHDDYLRSESDVERCINLLLSSQMLIHHPDRVTDKLIELVLLKTDLHGPDDAAIVLLALLCLEHKGSKQPHVFRLLKQRRPLPDKSVDGSVLQVLIQVVEKYGSDALAKNHLGRQRLGVAAARLLYEVCRVSRLSHKVLACFTETFVERLFFLVESTRDDDEIFNFTLVRLIIALNEQFMVASLLHSTPKSSHDQKHAKSKSSAGSHHRARSMSQPNDRAHSGPSKHHDHHVASPLHAHMPKPHPHHASSVEAQILHEAKLTEEPAPSDDSPDANVVLKVITAYLGEHKTFGENLIYMLNRCEAATAEDQCVALLILKILYLLFTTPRTHEYFYTNDLCVLIDIFLRGLDDLPEESEGLRHTFLRVLHPLMTNTQLKTIPYKRAQTRRALLSLVGDTHRRQINQTTKRLVDRNLKAAWSAELESLELLNSPSTPLIACDVATLGEQVRPKRATSHDQLQLQRRGSTLSVDSVESLEATAMAETGSGASLSAQDKIALSQTTSDANNLSASSASLPPSSLGISLVRPSSSDSFAASMSGRRKPPSPPKAKRAEGRPKSADATAVADVTSAAIAAPLPIKVRPPRPPKNVNLSSLQ